MTAFTGGGGKHSSNNALRCGVARGKGLFSQLPSPPTNQPYSLQLSHVGKLETHFQHILKSVDGENVYSTCVSILMTKLVTWE